jgi:hypothetical protein
MKLSVELILINNRKITYDNVIEVKMNDLNMRIICDDFQTLVPYAEIVDINITKEILDEDENM